MSLIQKIGSINLLRFIAAIAVVFYHYAYTFYHREMSYIDIPFLRYISKYGYLGVDLFFIISGFVIALSAENRNIYGFIKSRIGRLYPLFWISAIITSLFLLFGGHLIYSELSWYRFWTNMTMIPGLFTSPETYDLLDGSYWSLVIEIKFYALVGVLLLIKQFKNIEIYASISMISIIIAKYFNLIANDSDLIWATYFIAGIIFYKIFKTQILSYNRIIILLLSFIYSSIFSLQRDMGEAFKSHTIVLYILSFYIIFLLIAQHKINIKNNWFISLCGALTYPVYLLHQQIGKILFTYFHIQNIPLWISFISIFTFIVSLSYIIQSVFENPGRKILEKVIDKLVPGWFKRLG